MTTTGRNSWASAHLNLIRGLAALAVLVYHVRYRFFLDYTDVASHDLLAKAFYGLTSFGHDAVMIFFVLSGFFIAGSVVNDVHCERWSWKRYFNNRLTRLYVVLLPGLALTLFWDQLGLFLFSENPIYSGESRPWRHDYFPIAERTNVATFAGNVLFLQTILVPPLGSNEPLWSLSYEFWYYLIFPCLWIAVRRNTACWKKVLYALVAVAIIASLGKGIAAYFPIWLLGATIYLLPSMPRPLVKNGKLLSWAALGLFLIVLALTHTSGVRSFLGGSHLVLDYVNGLSFATFLYCVLHVRSTAAQGAYSSFASTIAGFSYTLYLIHMPMLVFLRALLIEDRPWEPDFAHICFAVVLSFLAVGYTWVVWSLTEAKTEKARAFLKTKFPRLCGSSRVQPAMTGANDGLNSAILSRREPVAQESSEAARA